MQANLIKSSAAKENQLKDVWIGAEAYVIDRLLRSNVKSSNRRTSLKGDFGSSIPSSTSYT